MTNKISMTPLLFIDIVTDGFLEVQENSIQIPKLISIHWRLCNYKGKALGQGDVYIDNNYEDFEHLANEQIKELAIKISNGEFENTHISDEASHGLSDLNALLSEHRIGVVIPVGRKVDSFDLKILQFKGIELPDLYPSIDVHSFYLNQQEYKYMSFSHILKENDLYGVIGQPLLDFYHKIIFP